MLPVITYASAPVFCSYSAHWGALPSSPALGQCIHPTAAVGVSAVPFFGNCFQPVGASSLRAAGETMLSFRSRGGPCQ